MLDKLNRGIGIAALSLVFCTACFAGPKTEVSSDFDKYANFSSLKTWAWHPAPPAHGYFFSEQEHAGLKPLIEYELAKKELTKASGEPDLWIYYDTVKADMKDRVYVGKKMGDDNTQWVDRSYAAGTILLDFTDPKTNRTVWRGWVQGELKSDLAPEKRKERISEALAKLLKAYPPK